MRIEVSTVIGPPIEEVWNVMAGLGTMPERDPAVVKADS